MSSLDDLLHDPETRRCWREIVTGEDALSIDGIRACYGEPRVTSAALAAGLGLPWPGNNQADDNRSPDDVLYEALSLATDTTSAQGESGAFEETSANESPAEPDLTAGLDAEERRLLRALEPASGTRSPEPSEGGFVLVPEDLAISIEQSYERIAAHGFLSDEEFAGRLAVWMGLSPR